MERRVTLLSVVLALVIVGLLPLAAMLGKSVFVDGKWTLAVYETLFANPRQYWTPIEHSLTLATMTAGCALVLARPASKSTATVTKGNLCTGATTI